MIGPRLALLIAVCVVSTGVVASAETVAWYRFEDGELDQAVGGTASLPDSGPNKLHGWTPYACNARYVAGIAPGSNVALELDERLDWLFVPDHEKLQLAESLTLEAFVEIKGYSRHGVANFIIFRGDNAPGWDSYVLSLDPRARALSFHIEGPGGKPGDPPATVTCPFRWIGVPIHVAGVLDAETGFLGLYVNGDLMASMETSTRPRVGLNPAMSPGLGIGGYHGGDRGSFAIHGTIDEVRISDAPLRPQQFICSVAHPTLEWVGAEGFEQDGVGPDAGPPNNRFLFAVRYVGPTAAPTVQLNLRRDGDPYRTITMTRARGRGEGDASVYRATVELGADVWEYQFTSPGASGEPSRWHDGPLITGPGRH
ncbi:MAG TPA: LamG-like jellyroll fold domain-containing protein [Armatimonadota bacterium]|nr:LamG-like jellyroll fold domain-containing protein [Armatimonadota bacterium]